MARVVLPIAGAVVGSFLGSPQIGWAIGAAIGNAVDPQTIKGPSIGDISQQTAQEGGPRPIVYGLSQPIAGNVIVTGEARVVRTSQRQGKGGPRVTSEAVFRTYAIGICEGPIAGVIRVWRNGILVFDARQGSTEDNLAFLEKARFFLGAYDQEPSSDLEALFGVGTTPAHRGTAYMVIADEDLTDLRGAIPQYTFQVSSAIGLSLGRILVYDEPGEHTYEIPQGITQVDVIVIGGGGGGAGGGLAPGLSDGIVGGWGGGGGGYSRATFTAAEVGPSIDLIVGAGGTSTGGHSGTVTVPLAPPVGDDGDGSSFGSLLVAGGGLGGGNPSEGADNGGAGTIQNGGRGGGDEESTVAESRSLAPTGGGGGGGSTATQIPIGGGDGGTASTSLTPQKPGGNGGAGGLTAGFGGNTGQSASEEEYEHSGSGAGGGGGAAWLSGDSGMIVGGTGANGATGGSPGGGGGGGGGAGASSVIAGVSGTGGAGGNGRVVIIEGSGTWDGGPISLADVITDVCARANLPAELIDVSMLPQELQGLTVTNAYPAYSILQSLSQIFLFDPSSRDGQVAFIPRGENTVATVTEDDMLDDGIEIEDEKRGDTLSIPRVLHLNYFDVDGGLAPDKQSSERAGVRRSTGESSIQSPVVMFADEAAQAVTINHRIAAEDQKGELRFSLSDMFLGLTTADNIFVQYEDKTVRARITKCDVNDGFQSYTLLRDRQSNYTSNVEGIPAAPQTQPPSSVVGPTLLEILDIPLIRDADDNVGLAYYVAIAGATQAWNGAQVELSLDGGANYVDAATSSSGAVIGELVTSLADHPAEFPDEVSSCVVRIHTWGGELEESDLEGLLNGRNLAIIGDELVQFASAQETSAEGDWELSYFLRGRLGSTSVAHASGERFVLLARESLFLVPANLVDLGRTLTFRATSIGATVDTATIESMTFTGRTQRERAVGYLEAHRDGSNVVISWQGVGRLGAGVSTAHGTRFSGYRVTVSEATSNADSVTTTTTSQGATIDVSSLSGTLRISVLQINSLTGDGPATEIEVI